MLDATPREPSINDHELSMAFVSLSPALSQWQQQKPAAWSPQQQPQSAAWGSKPGISAVGESVVPALVVFGDGSKASLKKHLRSLSEVAAAAVVAVHKVGMGAPRYHLHCRESNLPLVKSLVPLLVAAGDRAAVYELRPSSLPQHAAAGFAGAMAKAGICRYFERRVVCPHLTKKGRCNFMCYDGAAAMS